MIRQKNNNKIEWYTINVVSALREPRFLRKQNYYKMILMLPTCKDMKSLI